MYFFLLSYPILGAGIKYIDDAFDAKVFNKTIAIILAPLLGTLWAYTMIVDQVSATILLAILLGVLLKGKIDNLAHLLGLIFILGIVIGTGMQFLIFPLIFLTVAALFDEVGNDLIDKNHYLNGPKYWQKLTGYFFDQRWLTKVAVLGIVIIGVFPFYFFLAMLLFDGAYLLVHWYSELKRREPCSIEKKPVLCSDPILQMR